MRGTAVVQGVVGAGTKTTADFLGGETGSSSVRPHATFRPRRARRLSPSNSLIERREIDRLSTPSRRVNQSRCNSSLFENPQESEQLLCTECCTWASLPRQNQETGRHAHVTALCYNGESVVFYSRKRRESHASIVFITAYLRKEREKNIVSHERFYSRLAN